MTKTPFKLRSGNRSPLEFKQMGSSPLKVPIMAIVEGAKMAGKAEKADVEATMHASDRVMAGIAPRMG